MWTSLNRATLAPVKSGFNNKIALLSVVTYCTTKSGSIKRRELLTEVTSCNRKYRSVFFLIFAFDHFSH